jgi:hypothetical protein
MWYSQKSQSSLESETRGKEYEKNHKDIQKERVKQEGRYMY